MHAFSATLTSFLALVATASAGSRCRSPKGCNADNCARAVTGTAMMLARSSRLDDCSSFLQTAVTPAPSTVTVTVTPAPATVTSTVSTVPVFVGPTSTVTATATGILRPSLEMRNLFAGPPPGFALPTAPLPFPPPQPPTFQPQTSSLGPTTPTTSNTVLATFSPIAPLIGANTTSATAALGTVPAYASACSGAARYSSACSCAGVTKTTSTLAAAITTATVTAMAPDVTVDVTATNTVTDVQVATVAPAFSGLPCDSILKFNSPFNCRQKVVCGKSPAAFSLGVKVVQDERKCGELCTSLQNCIGASFHLDTKRCVLVPSVSILKDDPLADTLVVLDRFC